MVVKKLIGSLQIYYRKLFLRSAPEGSGRQNKMCLLFRLKFTIWSFSQRRVCILYHLTNVCVVPAVISYLFMHISEPRCWTEHSLCHLLKMSSLPQTGAPLWPFPPDPRARREYAGGLNVVSRHWDADGCELCLSHHSLLTHRLACQPKSEETVTAHRRVFGDTEQSWTRPMLADVAMSRWLGSG